MSSAGKPQDEGAGHRRWPFPARRIVFAVAATFTLLLGFDIAAFDGPALASDLPLLFGAGLILFGLAYVLLLSARLAGVAAICVLLAFTWSAGVLAICGVPMEPPVFAALLGMETVGEVLILLQLHAAIGDVCKGKSVVSAVHASMERMVAPSICALLAMLTGLVVLGDGDGLVYVLAAGAAGAVALTIANFSIAPAFASRVDFGEARIARANRARELAESLIARAAIVAKPRWAFAGLGIAAVVFAILLFGGNPRTPILLSPIVVLWREGGPALGFAFLVTAFIGIWLTRDWRAVFVAALPAYLAATVVTLLAAATNLAPAEANPALLVLGGSFGAVLCLFVADRFAAHRRYDGAADIAFQRSLNDCAMPVLAATAALALASLLLAVAHKLGPAVALVLTGEAALSLLLAGIFAAVVSDLFPRRHSFDEMYGAPRAQAAKR